MPTVESRGCVPAWMPALSDGPPANTLVTYAPEVLFKPSAWISARERSSMVDDPQVWIIKLPILDQARNDPLDSVDRNGKTDARINRLTDGVGAGGFDGAVDADHFPVQVQERTARIAGIERRIGLDDIGIGEIPAVQPGSGWLQAGRVPGRR